MDIPHREELIHSYYDAVDDESYDLFDDVFAEPASHIRPGQGSLHQRSQIRRFFETERRSSDTTHDVSNCVHEENSSLCKVTVTGLIDSEPFSGDIISEFQFDPDEEYVTQYRVFRGYQR